MMLTAIFMSMCVLCNENIASTCVAVCISACFVENYSSLKDS